MGRYVWVKEKKTKAHEPGHWSQRKRLEAVTTYLACGSPSLTATQINVPYETLQSWRKQDWWKEYTNELQNTDNDRLDSKLSKALDKAIEQINDRIENGDFVFDQKTGKVKQVPVKLRDLNSAMNTFIDKRQLLRKQPTKIIEQQTTQNQLQELAKQFAQFVTGKQTEEKEVNTVQEFIESDTVVQDDSGSYYVKE